MFLDGETAFLGDAVLAFFDFSVHKLLDLAALQANQVVVVIALLEFEHCLVAIEMVAHQQASLLELREHAIYRGQSNVLAVVGEQAIHFFGGHVTLVALFEQIENFQARQRGFQADVLEIGWIAQWGLQNGNANTL